MITESRTGVVQRSAVEQSMTILLGNEPRAYREVFARFLSTVGPDFIVHVVDPMELDESIARLDPDLVLCSQLTDAVAARRNWFLWSGTDAGGQLRRNGVDIRIANLDLASLLETVEAVDHGGDR
jgi:hypothetical protein